MKRNEFNDKNLSNDAEIASGLQTSPLVGRVRGESVFSIQKK